jgi:hypothetical protein
MAGASCLLLDEAAHALYFTSNDDAQIGFDDTYRENA